MGELALLFHRRFGVGAEPQVARLEGWERQDYWRETGLCWIPPSPNMPAPETAVAYPGTGMLEGTNVSEGRGTPLPFLSFGAPWIRSRHLVDRLRSFSLPGCCFSEHVFRPTSSKHAGELCEGAILHVVDLERFQPVRVGVAILQALKDVGEEQFEWRRSGSGAYSVDRLAGTTRIREMLDGSAGHVEISETWSASEAAMEQMRSEVEIYP